MLYGNAKHINAHTLKTGQKQGTPAKRKAHAFKDATHTDVNVYVSCGAGGLSAFWWIGVTSGTLLLLSFYANFPFAVAIVLTQGKVFLSSSKLLFSILWSCHSF